MLRHSITLIAAALSCAGCARPATVVLKPYALADGKMFQDVVTIAADRRGTAPVVTHVKTFELRTGYKGARTSAATGPVAAASGSAPGLMSTLAGSAASAGMAAATGIALSRIGNNGSGSGGGTTVSNTISNANNDNSTNNNTNTNSNLNTNNNTNNNTNP